MTDDQRAEGTLGVMGDTTDYFSDGVSFPNAIATTPLCCPSRSSIFTGRYAHNHHVRVNTAGAVRNLDQKTTLQYYLHQAGYRTGIFGKYFNGWDIDNAPPYFDEYAITKRGYMSALFGIGHGGRHRVKDVSEYSTDFIRDKAVGFLESAESEDARPWMLFVNPFAPHNPSIPAARHVDSSVPEFEPNPAMLESDLSDKPPIYDSYTEPYNARNERRIWRRRSMQLRSLMAVDDLVVAVTDKLEASGEDNTLVIFMSDNGYQWGEHGLMRKGLPYLPSLRIPLMLRWDGRVLSGVDNRLAANIDIAPTILDAAQVQPRHTVDGKSLLDSWERDEILTEVFPYEGRPDQSWASLISHDYQYTEYYGANKTVPVFREYYDLESDPWQLENVFADGEGLNKLEATEFSSRLMEYRTCPLVIPCP